MATILFYDLETTGLKVDRSAIHQLAGLIEVDGKIVEEIDLRMCPRAGTEYSPEALLVAKKTREEIEAYPPQREVFKSFIELLSKYVDRYDRKSKMYLAGYNNRGFDDPFLRHWFEHNNDKYFGSWFYAESLDVIVLAGQYFAARAERRKRMINFKLSTVATELGLAVQAEGLHDALYDVKKTREIYRIVTGVDEEGLL